MNKAELMELLYYLPPDSKNIIIGGTGNRTTEEWGSRLSFETDSEWAPLPTMFKRINKPAVKRYISLRRSSD